MELCDKQKKKTKQVSYFRFFNVGSIYLFFFMVERLLVEFLALLMFFRSSLVLCIQEIAIFHSCGNLYYVKNLLS